MDVTNAILVVLASMIFVLAGMIGYLFWQQNRLLQHVQSLAVIVANNLTPPQPGTETVETAEVATGTSPDAVVPTEGVVAKIEPDAEVESEDDDRASVENDDDVVETVEGPPPAKTESEKNDIDDIQDKTAVQLRELLTQKGIPFGKRDTKTVLIQLLKASS
jgi:hypothetical protein